jgi:carboxyl-terminal processing protease
MNGFSSKYKFLFRYVTIYIFIVFLIGSFLGGLFLGGKEGEKEAEKRFFGGDIKNTEELPEYLTKDADFNLFWQVWNLVKRDYIHQPVPDTKLFYGALSGIVSSMDDPYSVFLDPEMTKKFQEDLQGSFEGIGAEIGIKEKQLMIIAPLPDTPAEKAGLKAGDKILAIDGEDTTDMALDYAVSIIRGEKGTTVVLNIWRDDWEKPQDISIVRGVIEVSSVKWEMKDNLAYIHINHFNQDTEEKFNQAINELITKNPQGIILDLRNNPGGFLDTAVNVAGEWVEKNVIVIEKDSSGEQKELKSDGLARLQNLKTIILINEGSASASEIVAGALQDYKKAILVGKKTFGKGSVQSLEGLKDGSAVKITIAEWLTPKGRQIDRAGISPDVEVEFTTEDYNASRDPQMEKAIEILNKE